MTGRLVWICVGSAVAWYAICRNHTAVRICESDARILHLDRDDLRKVMVDRQGQIVTLY